MRASRQEQVGGAGASEVSAAFERLGWGVAENSRHDLGTDLFVLARDQRLFDAGLVVGVQVKTGEDGGAYFREPKRDDQGELLGWWFRDRGRRHVDAWLSHTLPHLIVLHNLTTRTSYWEHVTAGTVVPAGSGAKVFVPVGNTVDGEHRDALLRVAASNRPGIMWERSAWTGAASVAPRDLLRHALVVPRLVAPHPNAGYAAAVSPVQAVALLVQARLFDLRQFAEHHAQVPSPDEASGSAQWPWRFVGALAHRVATGENDRLLQVIDDGPDPAARTAATVTGAACLAEEGRMDEAIKLLEEELARDESEPVDHAWLMLQHARMCAEVGRLDQARSAALSAQEILVTNPDDVTATAIAGAAAEMLFNTAAWGQRDVKEVITAADTAASWWRTQTMSWALTALADRTYKAWAKDTAVVEVFGGPDTVNDELFAASLSASFAGDHADWRAVSTLLGRDMLLRLDRYADPADVVSALQVLRLAGDSDGLGRAVRHVVADGPASAVTIAASELRLDAATRTTGPADLALLQYGGDVLGEETAGQVITWLLATLNDPSAFTARTTPSYLVDLKLVDVLAAVVPAAPAGALAHVVNYIAGLPVLQNEALANSWARAVNALPAEAWTREAGRRCRRVTASQPQALRLSIWRAIAPLSRAVRNQLIAEARTGSTEAMAALGDVRNLPADVVSAAFTTLTAAIEGTIRQAHAGHHGYDPDSGRTLALLNLWHPDSARWDPLLMLLSDDAVSGGNKTAALAVLAALPDRIPGSIRMVLGTIAETVSGQPSRDALPDPLNGDAAAAVANLAAALGVFDAQPMADMLLTGNATRRRWAARCAGKLGTAECTGIVIALAGSDDPNVRATAASALAALVAAGNSDPITAASLQHCVKDPGTLVPATIAQAIASASARSADAEDILLRLRSHPSARVRRIATGAPRERA